MSALIAITTYLPALQLIMSAVSEFMGIINTAAEQDRDLTSEEIDRIDQLVVIANQAHAEALEEARNKLREQVDPASDNDTDRSFDPVA